jgi:GDP/UDP-N,N'-diacetylbacillosamine 2-epimerase (hydrolysing)
VRIYIPSTSRSDVPNTDALKNRAKMRGHELTACALADYGIVLGDRIEMLDEAKACIMSHAPYVHVGAGCITRGAWDQRVRDMLTVGASALWGYSALAREDFAKRSFVDEVKFGHPWGVPVLDDLKPTKDCTRSDFVLVALNPVTAHNVGEELDLVYEIHDACRYANRPAIWSWPNEDPCADKLAAAMQALWGNDQRAAAGQFRWYMDRCHCMVGNSSSALIEAPVIGTPFVDCGCRQEGRPLAMGLRGDNRIAKAINAARPFSGQSPYQHPKRNACTEIIELAEELSDEKH